MINKIIYMIIGLMLFLSGVYYAIEAETVDYIVMSILLASGVGFLLFPTTFVKYLKQKLNKTSKD